MCHGNLSDVDDASLKNPTWLDWLKNQLIIINFFPIAHRSIEKVSTSISPRMGPARVFSKSKMRGYAARAQLPCCAVQNSARVDGAPLLACGATACPCWRHRWELRGNYPYFTKYGNLPLCLENCALFSLPLIFTKNIYTYTLSNILYLG